MPLHPSSALIIGRSGRSRKCASAGKNVDAIDIFAPIGMSSLARNSRGRLTVLDFNRGPPPASAQSEVAKIPNPD